MRFPFFYVSPRQIPELQSFSLVERAQIVQLAERLMPVPRRWCGNMIKLLVLGLFFYSLVNVSGWYWQALALLLAVLCYPLIIQPITLNLARPYYKEAVAAFTRRQQSALHEAEHH